MDLRITSGEYKNKKLKVPKSASPVRERVKLAVFSILDDKITNANCIDICAGTGNLGLEAISRGANSCTFIEEDYEAVGIIKENIQNILGLEVQPNHEESEDKIKLIRGDMVRYIANDTEKYDIVFWDPPYKAHVKHALKYIDGLINEKGILVYFHETNNDLNMTEINPALKIVDSRQYGITTVDFIAPV